MADELRVKPLPTTPEIDEVPALTIDAVAHLSAIIRYSVKVRSLSPEWAAPVDMGVKKLVEWLTSNAEFIHESRILRQKALLQRLLGAPGKPDAPDEPVMVNDASLAADAEKETINNKQTSLQRLWSTLQAQKHGTDHLLVTVAAPPAAVTAQDLSFLVIPASRGCVFETSTFHLPFFEDADGTTQGEGGSIICGLNGKLIIILLKESS